MVSLKSSKKRYSILVNQDINVEIKSYEALNSPQTSDLDKKN